LTHDPTRNDEREVMTPLDQLFAALATSSFRCRFRLDPKERAYLHKVGLAVILEHGRDFIDKRLAPANPLKDGKQTPFRGHPVFVAQHATATCCRSCLEKWHGIPRGEPLGAAECAHVLAAIERWIRTQLGASG
jgi:hypothetical protein